MAMVIETVEQYLEHFKAGEELYQHAGGEGKKALTICQLSAALSEIDAAIHAVVRVLKRGEILNRCMRDHETCLMFTQALVYASRLVDHIAPENMLNGEGVHNITYNNSLYDNYRESIWENVDG